LIPLAGAEATERYLAPTSGGTRQLLTPLRITTIRRSSLAATPRSTLGGRRRTGVSDTG